MKTTIKNTLAAALLTGVVALSGLTACSSSDDNIADETPIVNPTQPKTYHVRIHASMGDGTTRAVSFDADGSTITTTFKTTDKIYVYNQTKGTWAANGVNASYTTLSPTTEGQQTELTGALKFYYMDTSTQFGTITLTPIAPEAGDVLYLYYNINDIKISQPKLATFEYPTQTGSAASASAHDFAEATMKIKSIDGNESSGYTLTLCQVDDEAKTTAEFTNLGSTFRQHLTFKNASNETVTPNITKMKISSKNDKLVWLYYAYDRTNSKSYIEIQNTVINTNGDIYLALRFDGSSTGDALTLTAIDVDGNYYECTKTAPEGGFQNGKYYHGSMTLNWTKQLVMPTVIGVTSMNEPDTWGNLNINDDPVNMTISGTSIGYSFRPKKTSTITLDNVTATISRKDCGFIDNPRSGYSTEIVLTGANTITNNAANAFYGLCFSGSLKISCTGTSATLTITCGDSRWSGISATNFPANTADYSVLAKEGYTISRTGGSNGDGTYTWTYTVAPAQ